MIDCADDFDAGLPAACARWQSGQDGSSLLRGAARVITGVPHYFRAVYIAAYEERAAADPQAMCDARALLCALDASERRDAEGWASVLGVPGSASCWRGLKPNPGNDSQIEAQLALRWIDMPLWGVSLSQTVAGGYGARFVFQLDGPFPAVPASQHSGIKQDEQELITGGHYTAKILEPSHDHTRVSLRWIRVLDAPGQVVEAGCDAVGRQQ